VVPGLPQGSVPFCGPRANSSAAQLRTRRLTHSPLTAHKARDAETVDWSVRQTGKDHRAVYMGMTAAPSVRAGLLAAAGCRKKPRRIFAR